MENDPRRAELRAFLVSRRARLLPEEVGLPSGGRRRVGGLRREEVAALAGVGVTWYTMFETGTAHGISDDVVASVARALRLSKAEREHLATLAQDISLPTGDTVVDPLILRALEHWIEAPAYVATTTWDVLAWNAAFTRVWAIEPPGSPPFNAVLRHFVDPGARAMHGENWRAFAEPLVAMVRTGYGRHLRDERYLRLVEALREFPEFVTMWERHDVTHPLATTSGAIVSPNVGLFHYEVLNLPLPTSDQQALIVQVPDAASVARFRAGPVR